MKTFAKLTMMLLAVGAASCNNNDIDPYTPGGDKKYNEFDFSTVKDGVEVDIDYANTGVKSNIYFEIYDENPVTLKGNSLVKKDGVTPLFAGYTDEDGSYSGTVNLPSYVSDVYVYTSSFFAQTVMTGTVVNGTLRVTDTDESDVATASRATRATTQGLCYMTTPEASTPQAYRNMPRWKEWLGTYDANGKVTYVYDGTEMVPPTTAYNTHSQIINASTVCPEEYRVSSDLTIDKDAEVVLTLLGGNTCWNSSLGYYFYKEGEEPQSLDDIHPVLVFPNTQDGKWNQMGANDKLPGSEVIGADRMTSIMLKYYPNIASGSKEGETTVFPAGYKVGLILSTNAWSKRLNEQYMNGRTQTVSSFKQDRPYVAATNMTLNRNKQGQAVYSPRTACYQTDGGFTIVSFEDDYEYDQNFSDVVCALGTNPVDAITDVPVVDNSNKNNAGDSYLVDTNIRQGCYLFEDLWPNKGDYDMNDVVVEYTYARKLDKWNDTYGESFYFTMYENYAANTNGFGFKITGALQNDASNKNTQTITPKAPVRGSVKLYGLYEGETEFQEIDGLQYDPDEQVYIVTSNVKAPIKQYRVDVGRYGDKHYKGTRPTGDDMNYKGYISQIDPFIWKSTTSGKRWEVHLTGSAPTSLADLSYFGTADDASDPVYKIYYVRNGNYPFALFLSGASYEDITKLLDRSNEGKAIDTLYPAYNSWVQSEGRLNANWYKN